jgi:DNA-binding transcriptional MerR regulator
MADESAGESTVPAAGAAPAGEPGRELALSIGEVAQRTGLSVHALRFYEREGLFADPVRRGAGGRRIYGEFDLEWLELCTKLRSSGMPLTAIRRYAGLVRQGAGNEPERLALLRRHQREVAAQIDALAACLEMITFKVGSYEERLAQGGDDPLWNPAEIASAGAAPGAGG